MNILRTHFSSLSKWMGNTLLAVRYINHKYSGERRELKMKKTLHKPKTYRLQAQKKVALYENVLRGSVDENCSAPGSQYQSCKGKCC